MFRRLLGLYTIYTFLFFCLVGNTGRKIDFKIRYLGTIAQLCRAISL